jgi:hypothetical protein
VHWPEVIGQYIIEKIKSVLMRTVKIAGVTCFARGAAEALFSGTCTFLFVDCKKGHLR